MDNNQLFEAAKAMFLQGKSKADISDFLMDNGIPSKDANTMATNAYLAVRDQYVANQERLQATQYQSERSGGGVPSWAIYVGILLLINFLSYIFNWSFWIY
ncbi:MAG: hypothetical protein AAF806_19580 [Bacteroidota bacterium]